MKSLLRQLKKTEVYVLFFLTCITGYKIIFKLTPYPTGDAAEYILTTEAFVNHFSPSITSKESKSFKENFLKKKSWEQVSKPGYFDNIETFLTKEKKTFKENFAGIYVAKNGKNYSYHFPFYSIINVPARIFCSLANRNPLGAFQVTNGILILIACACILFFNKNISVYIRILTALSFFYSSVYWYLGWVHPELMTACFVALSLWFFWGKKMLFSIWLMTLASLQNQPLLLMVGFLSLHYLLTNKFNIKSILALLPPGLLALLPSIFYFVLFNTFNLVKDQGFLSDEVVSLTRILGFFFDINQGILLAIPIALFVFIILQLNNLRHWREWKSNEKLVLLPIVLIATILSFSTMKNWNHGQAVIIRYGVWMSTILLIYVMYTISQKENLGWKICALLITASQIGTVLYHEKYNIFDWTWFEHKPLAKFILDNYPKTYNPDPHIFFVRTTGKDALDTNQSPVVYKDKYDNIKKIMVHRSTDEALVSLGFNIHPETVKKECEQGINGWAYFNEGELNYLDFSEWKKIVRQKYIKETRKRIYSTPEWMDQIKSKAAERKISIDSMVSLDAIYILETEK